MAYFEGLYFKQQNENDVLAVIPSLHTDENKNHFASLQIITNDFSYRIKFSGCRFRRSPFLFSAGENIFTLKGFRLNCALPNLKVNGAVSFKNLTPPKSDIMGPFRFLPLMQCRHSVFSTGHDVDGFININGKKYLFDGGRGYIEGDRGVSFPKRYIWTQCLINRDISVMLCAADIEYGGLCFTGVIADVYFAGKEIRLATYNGAKITDISENGITVKCRDYILTARFISGASLPLSAPQNGGMCRTIHESAACRVQYTLTKGQTVLFDVTGNRAGFESTRREK